MKRCVCGVISVFTLNYTPVEHFARACEVSLLFCRGPIFFSPKDLLDLNRSVSECQFSTRNGTKIGKEW